MSNSTNGKKPRTAAYRLFYILLYGELPWVTWDCGRGIVETGKLSRLLRLPSHRVKDHLMWLQEQGVVEKVDWRRGKFFFTPVLPKCWREYSCAEFHPVDDTDRGIEFVLDESPSCPEVDIPHDRKVAATKELTKEGSVDGSKGTISVTTVAGLLNMLEEGQKFEEEVEKAKTEETTTFVDPQNPWEN